MRELKFRMWTGTNMLYDDKNVIECLRQQRFFDTGTKLQPEIGVWPYDHISDGSAFMQFTGLKDKNGVDIFEGDIVEFIDTEYTSNESGSSYDDLAMVEDIVWNEDECGWDVSSRNYIDRQDFLDQCSDDVKVIGNIYQHKHLLK